MRLQKIVICGGDSTTFPSAGELIKVHYSLWLRDKDRPDDKGKKLETSRKRGVFTTQIGVGKVVKGWDILVAQMSLGELALLRVPSQLAYGSCGFPNLVPPDADLILSNYFKSLAKRFAGRLMCRQVVYLSDINTYLSSSVFYQSFPTKGFPFTVDRGGIAIV